MAGVHPSVSNYSLTNPKEADLELHPTTFAEPPRCYPPVSSWEITELNGCLNTFWGVLYFIVKGPNVSPAMCLIKVDGQQSSSIDPLERISDLEVRPFLELPMDQLNNIQLSKHAGYRWMVIVCQRHFRYHWIKSYNKIISIYIAIFVVLHMLHQNKNTFAGRPPPMHLDSVSAGSTSKWSKTLRVETSRTVTRFDIPWPKDRGSADFVTLEAGFHCQAQNGTEFYATIFLQFGC